MKAKDTRTILALAGAPHYLSGLSAERHALLTRQYHELTQPVVAKRLRVQIAARDHVESKGPLIFSQLEHALGYRWRKVVDARERHKKANKALKSA